MRMDRIGAMHKLQRHSPVSREPCSYCADVSWSKGPKRPWSVKKREQPPRAPILDNEKEARLIQLASSKLPSGHA